ncbi:hypothetical protein GCM10008995_18290 [Halobellus salinus]|uniref:Pyrrolo-quinoline quinone repeat domain-containing protein n=1 Tax=Halobellus salinus TaxID=931585 RepID=A0A830EGW7_9EURY|nr:PQQ-binding-like beta-propeller repeat protein [Halobellus salinus]GGJ08796.1 hypothetical protein GCM10008995_18290 [Halobellus salinus]SMP26899.1 Outer membrane protein assembly factor BamB, contains PQQ-like beta-propeller repeat [Halobellus salinus]
MDRTRRRLLAALGITGGGALGGCLRLTDSGEEASAAESTAARPSERSTAGTAAGTEPETGTESRTDGATISCTADTQPPTGAERFTHPFGDSRNSFAVPERDAPAEQPCLAWTQSLSGQANRVFTGPVVTGEHVILYSSREFRARRRTDGMVAWDGAGTPGGGLSKIRPVGMLDGNLLVSGQNRRTYDLMLVAIDDTGSAAKSAVVYEAVGLNDAHIPTGRVVGDRVYLVSSDSANEETRVLAYDWADGAVVWEKPIGGVDLRLEDMGADADAVVITSDETVEGKNNVWALASDDGSVRWSTRLPVGEGVPVLDDSHLYLPIEGYDSDSVTSQVRAMSKATGDVAWTFEVQNPPRTGVSVDDERVYLVAGNQLYAVDSDTGSPEWRFSPETGPEIRGDANGLPIVCRNTLLLGSAFSDEAPARVRAVNKTTGELRWSFGVDGTSVQSPIPVDGALYAVVEDRSEEDTRAVLYSFYK